MAKKAVKRTNTETTRTVLGFLELVGWVAIIIGCFSLFGAIDSAGNMNSASDVARLVAGSGLGGVLLFYGLVQVGLARVGALHVENAEMNREMLDIMRAGAERDRERRDAEEKRQEDLHRKPAIGRTNAADTKAAADAELSQEATPLDFGSSEDKSAAQLGNGEHDIMRAEERTDQEGSAADSASRNLHSAASPASDDADSLVDSDNTAASAETRISSKYRSDADTETHESPLNQHRNAKTARDAEPGKPPSSGSFAPTSASAIVNSDQTPFSVSGGTEPESVREEGDAEVANAGSNVGSHEDEPEAAAEEVQESDGSEFRFDHHGIGWYRGKKVARDAGAFVVDGEQLDTPRAVKRHINASFRGP